MQDQNSQPYYKLPSIGTLKALSNILGLTQEELLDLANQSDSLYRIASLKEKPDGTIRVTYDAYH